ncbi:hypothetical protein HYH02_009177 [Chlamydomonas schloesseri]|uniref:Uncharacterized protein n=1 Tax=Chlamydomonas schloesseri TaxID=2026947 RepID=A0A836B0E2_9CHLO|nr:hypothetical protein HYH02_009177 [Chlamydomonas schloesseri]|eukprot:KAG2443976.1 hypothetical protein HYH02_009177 [Chlamydomonas schloesseri]
MAGRKQQRTSTRRKAPKAGGDNTSQSQRVHIHINNAAAPRRPANTRTMQRELLLGPMGLRGLPYMAAPSTTIINQMPSDAYNARFATDALLQGLQSEVRALKSENMGLHDHIDQAWGQVAAAFKPPSYPSDSDFTSTAYGAGGSSSSGGSSGGGPPAPHRAPSVKMQDADSASGVPMPKMPPMLLIGPTAAAARHDATRPYTRAAAGAPTSGVYAAFTGCAGPGG